MSVGIPLKHIIDSLLIEEGRDSKHKFLPYLHLANDGLRELMWDVHGSTNTEVLVSDKQGVCKLPKDFVKLVRVSSLVDNTLIPLGRNDDIFKTKDGCGVYSGNNIPNNYTGGVVESSAHYSNGQFIGRYYGIGGRSVAGEYKISGDEIWLGNNVSSANIIIEYIGYMPKRVGGQFMVHPFLKEPLMNWIQYASRRRIASAGEIEYLFKRYVDSKNWARQRFWNMDFTEVLEIARKNFTQSPSR